MIPDTSHLFRQPQLAFCLRKKRRGGLESGEAGGRDAGRHGGGYKRGGEGRERPDKQGRGVRDGREQKRVRRETAEMD